MMKKIKFIVFVFFLTSCSGVSNKISTVETEKSISHSITPNGIASKKINEVKKIKSKPISTSTKNNEDKFLSSIIEAENKEKNKTKTLQDCKKYKGGFKLECQLDVLFSKNNKKGCELAKEKGDTSLYKKCLEVEDGIQKYKQIRRWKYYYETYYHTN